MPKSAGFGFGWLHRPRSRVLGAALILFMFLNPAAVRGASRRDDSFRAGLFLSRTRPLTSKQETALLDNLRRWTGFVEIRAEQDGLIILGDRRRVTGGSATARALILAAVDGSDAYSIESFPRSPEVAFARIRARLDYVNARSAPGLIRHSWAVDLDPLDYQELRGQAEAVEAFGPALNLFHELAHAVLHLRDAISAADSLGDCERYINRIRRELALPERESYLPVKQRSVTFYGNAQRILGELTFVRIDAEKRTKKFRLTFDVENVLATG